MYSGLLDGLKSTSVGIPFRLESGNAARREAAQRVDSGFMMSCRLHFRLLHVNFLSSSSSFFVLKILQSQLLLL